MSELTPLYELPVTAENPCNCHSYNSEVGETPNRLMTAPDGKEVCIDECIADTLQHLWDQGTETINSCCGHGRIRPSIILEQGCTKRHAAFIRASIKQVDSRDFDLLSWHLIKI